MSVYMTEEEQLDAIKKWWARYGTLVTVLLSLVLLISAGYRYMNWHQAQVKQQASISYEHLMGAFSNHNNKEVLSYANELINNYDKSVYADAAHLILAKLFVSKNQLDKAQLELQQVSQYSKMPAMKQIAKLRLARILTSKALWAKALNELEQVDDSAYLPIINELKGDIYNATNRYQEAMKAYQAALDENKINGMGNLYLEMKKNELALKIQPLGTEEKTKV